MFQGKPNKHQRNFRITPEVKQSQSLYKLRIRKQIQKNQTNVKETLEQSQKSIRAKVCTNPEFGNKFEKSNKH